MQQVSQFRFPAIGSIYTKHIIAYERNRRGPIKTFDIPGADNFCVGPLINSNFYNGRQRSYASYSGPYQSEVEWITSMIDMMIEAARVEPLDIQPK
jgi:hypothetical protein